MQKYIWDSNPLNTRKKVQKKKVSKNGVMSERCLNSCPLKRLVSQINRIEKSIAQLVLLVKQLISLVRLHLHSLSSSFKKTTLFIKIKSSSSYFGQARVALESILTVNLLGLLRKVQMTKSVELKLQYYLL